MDRDVGGGSRASPRRSTVTIIGVGRWSAGGGEHPSETKNLGRPSSLLLLPPPPPYPYPIHQPAMSVGRPAMLSRLPAAAAAITTKEKSARAFSTKNWSHATPSDRRAAQKVVDRSYTSFYFSTTHDRVEHLK